MRRISAAATLLFVSLAPHAATAAEKVPLPSAAADIRKQIRAEQLLNGGKGIERTLPGPVRDTETVDVTLGATGNVVAVHVRQHLVLHGLGDFFFRVPGPALDVEALARSGSAPGLKNGSVVWQGFSSGRKLLAADVTLDPATERSRLPLRARLSLAVDGEPLKAGSRIDGHLELDLAIAQAASSTRSLPHAQGDPRSLGRLLDRTAEAAGSLRRPQPGEGAIPRRVRALTQVKRRPEEVFPGFLVVGQVFFPGLDAGHVSATGGRVGSDDEGATVSFLERLGRGAERIDIAIDADLDDAPAPQIRFSATPAPPPGEALAPPVGSSWREAAARGVTGRDMFARAMQVYGDIAATRAFDTYLGNPDLDGPSAGEFRYAFDLAPDDPSPPRVPAPEEDTPVSTIVLAFLATALLGLVGILAWSLN